MGLRQNQEVEEEEYDGAELAVHRIGSTPDREVNGWIDPGLNRRKTTDSQSFGEIRISGA
jgi:hypothetical protein